MSPNYKLTYFNARGRAELSRIILHYAQIPFEDVRLEHEQWLQYKPNTTFGKLPVLEVDGKMLAQSVSIARYLARQHGLGGKDDWEQAQVDMYADCVADLIAALYPIMSDKDESKRKEGFMKFNTDNLQLHLIKVEKHLTKNGTGFLVGDSLTWADLAYYSFLMPLVERHGEDNILPSNYPILKKLLLGTIDKTPQIKEYIESRPKTNF